MPRVLQHTPHWLSRPSAGFSLFDTPDAGKIAGGNNDNPYDSPLRSIAYRGTEIFVAVGKELRWADLSTLKHAAPDFRSSRSGTPAVSEEELKSYKTLKIPVARPIRQLLISPLEDYIAIITSHTCHIAVIPDASHLASEDAPVMRIKTFHLGPTTHVLERSRLATALWHPLGVDGKCLVTVTVDSVVRLWEIDKGNKWSFDVPALAIDLKKLVDGLACTQDFTPSKYGANKGYSPDSFDMEASCACFGGTGQENEAPWAAMTLWLGMRGGDVYALCPLVPSGWQTHPAHVEMLEEHLISNGGEIEAGAKAWLDDLIRQNKGDLAQSEWSNMVKYSRPKRPGAVPKLQGPFSFPPDADAVFDITDIYAIAANDVEADDELQSPAFNVNAESSATGILCLTTTENLLHVFLDMEGVRGAWLPSKKMKSRPFEVEEPQPELLLVESVSLDSDEFDSWPVITPDANDDSSLFVTHSGGVSHVNLSAWTSRMSEELDANETSGLSFRMDILLDSGVVEVSQVIEVKEPEHQLPACINILDQDFGHFILTSSPDQPMAVTLDNSDLTTVANASGSFDEDYDLPDFVTQEPRATYQAPPGLWTASSLNTFMEDHVHDRNRSLMSEEVKISPATLSLLVEAHRIMGQETRRLDQAAADLFRRCERLQEEFREQIRRTGDVATRIDVVVGDVTDVYDNEEDAEGREALIHQRVENARLQNEDLTSRYTELRRKLNKLNGRPLSEKEQAWVEEVHTLDHVACDHEDAVAKSPDELSGPAQRFGAVRRIKEQLLEQSREYQSRHEAGNVSPQAPKNELHVSAARKKAVWRDITTMLERQTTLVKATQSKLEGLTVG